MSDLVPISQSIEYFVLCWTADAVLVASLLAVAAHLAARLQWLNLGPAARHALWLVVLLKLVTPPLVHWPWSASIQTPTALAAHARQADGPALLADQRELPQSVAGTEGLVPADDATGQLVASDFDRQRPATKHASNIDNHGSREAPVRETSCLPVADRQTRPVVRIDVHSLGREAGRWAIVAWLAGAIISGIRQANRIYRFHRRVCEAFAPPRWLESEAARIARLLDVRAPRMRVMSGSGTPRLWCFGRPILLVPGELLTTLAADRWRGILAHELAHLRRDDHWVCRVALVAGLAWWWNPLYWWTVRRLGAEAELACDAWVVSILPQERQNFAEALVQICASMSLARPPAPSLGAAGTGRFFERRLTMILNERVPCRLPALGYLAAALLAVTALPAWLVAAPAERENAPTPILTTDAYALIDNQADEDADDAIDEGEIELRIEKALGPDFEKRMEALGERIGREIGERFGPAFQKRMEAFGKALEKELGPDFQKKAEAFGNDVEKNFGPEFQKKMESIGKEFEKSFGPEFQKKMESIGKQFEKTFGPEFQKEMEALGKELETNLGPELEKALKTLGDEFSKELGPGSEFEKKIKQLKEKSRAMSKDLKPDAKDDSELSAARDAAARAREQLRAAEANARKAAARVNEAEARARARADREAERVKAKPDSDARAARIRDLESRIKELANELERLKSQDSDKGKED